MTTKPPSSGTSGDPLGPDDMHGLTELAQAIPPADPRRLAASIAMFDRLTEHWSLRADERETLLGGVSKSTWSEWRGHRTTARIKPDTRERIGNLFVIDLNAHSLFAPEFADRWIRESNAAFEGESPMTTMLRGKFEDLIRVRRYLERIRTSSSTDAVNGSAAVRGEAVGISLLPGDAVESPAENDEALAALRQVVAVYTRRALEEPPRYDRILADVLNAYAACLADTNELEAEPVLQQLVEVQRRLAATHALYERDLTRTLTRLRALMRKRGDSAAASGFHTKSKRPPRGPRGRA
jgi:Antitoxin Xre/MbcA/ParS C-terminal toxin-binding domain